LISIRSAFFTLPFLFFVSVQAHAVITVTAVTGASGFVNTPSAPAIYGGSAPACTSALTACNPNPINAGTVLTMTISSSTSTTGIATIESGTATPITSSGTSISGINQTATVSIGWSQLCGAAATLDPTCTTPFSASFQVGFNSSGVSSTWNASDDHTTLTVSLVTESINTVTDCTQLGTICNFWAFPGDKGVYLTDISTAAGFPTGTAGTALSSIVVYISQTSWDNANPTQSDQVQYLTLDSLGNYNQFIGGLQNDPATPYYFRIASQDVAGNIFGFTDPTLIPLPAYGNCLNATVPPAPAPITDPGSDPTCRFRANPDQVLGILAKDMNCFVATAAYGSSLEPKLQTFRDFRFRYLLPNTLGRKFVMSYYRWGPYAARWISEREWARTASRAMLWPAWGFAALSLKVGLEKAILLTIMALILASAGLAALVSFTKARKLRHAGLS
jgi:hypothetical protein